MEEVGLAIVSIYTWFYEHLYCTDSNILFHFSWQILCNCNYNVVIVSRFGWVCAKCPKFKYNWATLLSKSGPRAEVEWSERHEASFTRTFRRRENLFPIISNAVNAPILVYLVSTYSVLNRHSKILYFVLNFTFPSHCIKVVTIIIN